MAVIVVPAAAIQANTTLIHTIQAPTDDTHDAVIMDFGQVELMWCLFGLRPHFLYNAILSLHYR
jgi:hypothetical protein